MSDHKKRKRESKEEMLERLAIQELLGEGKQKKKNFQKNHNRNNRHTNDNFRKKERVNANHTKALDGSSLKIWRPKQGDAKQAIAANQTQNGPKGLDQFTDEELWGEKLKDESNDKGESENKDDAAEEAVEKKLPDFRPSGKLAAAALEKNGVVLKHGEPPNARLPPNEWRFYVFKGDDELDPIRLTGATSFLIGRDKRVCEMHLLHESISGQHAVLQFREVQRKQLDLATGHAVTEVIPSIIDLKSTNGTFLNGKRIQDSIYIELKEEDSLKFGESTREFVLLKVER